MHQETTSWHANSENQETKSLWGKQVECVVWSVQWKYKTFTIMHAKVLIVGFFIWNSRKHSVPRRKVEFHVTLSTSPISPSDLFYVAWFFFTFFLFHWNGRQLKCIETILTHNETWKKNLNYCSGWNIVTFCSTSVRCDCLQEDKWTTSVILKLFIKVKSKLLSYHSKAISEDMNLQW